MKKSPKRAIKILSEILRRFPEWINTPMTKEGQQKVAEAVALSKEFNKQLYGR